MYLCTVKNISCFLDVTPIESEILEERAVRKALTEAAKDLEKPNIITKQEEETKKK